MATRINNPADDTYVETYNVVRPKEIYLKTDGKERMYIDSYGVLHFSNIAQATGLPAGEGSSDIAIVGQLAETKRDGGAANQNYDVTLGTWKDVINMAIEITVPSGKTWQVSAVGQLMGVYPDGPRSTSLRIGDGTDWGMWVIASQIAEHYHQCTALFYKNFGPGTHTIKGQFQCNVQDLLEGCTQELRVVITRKV